MLTGNKERIPIKEGLWTKPSKPGEKSQLIASRCSDCGELFFPKKEKGLCIHCQGTNLEDIKLSYRGKISNFSIVMIEPAGGFYKGPVPYVYGCVELPEGIRIKSLLTADNLDDLRLGMDVEMVIEKIDEDNEGNEIMTFKFKPMKE